ncbi:hypothetical protein G7039_21750 [Rhizobium leguminosarum]|nr:hypothetical protein G7039_21750 [Rhizobium leguminosarum]
MNKTWKHLFEGVFLPAVAGNVLWTFLTMILDGFSFVELPRLFLLLILGFYLLVAWLLYKTIDISKAKPCYWLFEAAYLLALTVTALAAQYSPEWLRIIVSIYFAIVVVGHFANAWSEADNTQDLRWRLVLLNVVGLGILWLAWWLGARQPIVLEWSVPFSFAFALWLWIKWIRRKLGTIESRMPN